MGRALSQRVDTRVSKPLLWPPVWQTDTGAGGRELTSAEHPLCARLFDKCLTYGISSIICSNKIKLLVEHCYMPGTFLILLNFQSSLEILSFLFYR